MHFRFCIWFSFVGVIATVTSLFDPCFFWPGSRYINGKCLTILPDKGNFLTAKDKCTQVQRGAVAEVRTQEEKEVLRSLISPNSVFIGLTESVKKGEYLWSSDGLPLKRSQNNWHISCQSPINPVEANCTVLNANGDLSCWDCAWKGMYIACQLDVGNPCDLFLPGAEYFKGSCFLYVEGGSGVDGQAYCEEKDAFLVEPKTPELLEYIKGFANRYTVSNFDYGIRIGAEAIVPGNWTWITSGESLISPPWSSGEPNELDTERAIFMVLFGNWNWNNYRSDRFPKFICQRDIGDPCEEDLPGGAFMLGSCFKYFDSRITWQSAKSACTDHGGFLAEPKTKHLSDLLINYYSYVMGTSGNFVWLGASQGSDDQWKWTTSGESVENITWNTNEPNNAFDGLGPENVMVLSPNRNTIGWNDVSEKHLWGYICQQVAFPKRAQSYLAVLPAPDENTMDDVVVYVTTGFESHIVYLKFTTSCGRILKTTVSYLTHREFVMEKGGLCLNSTGLHAEYVLVEASNMVTVVIGRSSSMTLIYPISLNRGLFHGLSFFINADPSSSLTVASLMDRSNSIRFHLTKGTQNVKFELNQVSMNLRYPFNISAETRGRFLPLSVNVSSTSGSLFVDSSYPATVYLDHQKENATTKVTYLSYNQILPVHLLGQEYVAFPDLPATEGRRTMLKVVAVHEDTHILVYGAKLISSRQAISLPFAGDATTVPLGSDDFFFVNGSEIFYAMLIFADSDVDQLPYSCMTPLLPTQLWRKQYDFTTEFTANLPEDVTYVVVVIDTLFTWRIEVFPVSDFWTCTAIPGTNWSGCYRQLMEDYSTTYSHIKLNNHAAPFAAYLLSRNRKSSICYPLGVATKPRITSDFDKEAYLQTLQDPNPCVFASTTTYDLPDTANGYMTTSEGFREPSTVTSSKDFHQTTSEETTTTTSDTTETPASTITSHITTKATSLITPTSAISSMLTTIHESKHIYNDEKFKTELAKLHINRKDTLAYKRSKFSIRDLRMSAAAIGVVGLIFVVTIVGVVVVSDVFNLCRNSAKYGCYKDVQFTS